MALTSQASTEFDKWYKAFYAATPRSYRDVSFNATRIFHGPEIPDDAFNSVSSLATWYRAVLRSWLFDVYRPWDYWKGKLPTKDHELALLNILREAHNTGVRRIQRRVFRDRDNIIRDSLVIDYSDLNRWCDLMFTLLEDDNEHVTEERQRLTIRYDKGVAYRLEEEHKERLTSQDKWVAEMLHAMMSRLSKGKPHLIEPDDEWILVIWTGMTDFKQPLREAVVSLFVDAEKLRKKPHERVLDDIVTTTWKGMRTLGPVCSVEPRAATERHVRASLDKVKLFCAKQLAKHSRLLATSNTSKGRMLKSRKSEITGTQPKVEMFDAFMAHNSADKDAVQTIGSHLRKRGLKPWIDKEQIRPGRFFQEAIQEILSRCKAALVIIGRSGLGRWQTLEIRTLITRCLEQNIPVIPVLLPGAQDFPSELLFLRELQWVKFRNNIDENDVLEAIVWGVTGSQRKSRRRG